MQSKINIPANFSERLSLAIAHILGHGGKGKAKTISEADRQGRTERMKALNAKRSAGPENAQAEARRQ